MNNKKRITALCLAFAIAIALAFSVLFIAHNSEHKCSGADCSICAQINNCVEKLNNISPKPETSDFSAPVLFCAVLCVGAVIELFRKKSLIELKVKLSN
ncbi:MAG: hypothetical protein IKN26_02570 [Eubacterium sp.]|nr:hypothetical protein [Eubacterium sp.]MBR4241833.1 hypothetical protein [Eubacterium sp.]